MDMSNVRKANLKALVDSETDGNVAEFCRRYGLDDTWLRQLFNNEKKRLGEKAARNFEEKIGIPINSLDQPEARLETPNGVGEIERAIGRATFLSEDQKTHLIGFVKSLRDQREK